MNLSDKLASALSQSTLTPASYTPSDEFKMSSHAAVTVDGVPVLLTGWSDDSESVRQSKALAYTGSLTQALKYIGLNGYVDYSVIDGHCISWLENYSCVAMSRPENPFEDMVMVVNLTGNAGLTTLMCVETEIANIIDPNCPPIMDGSDLMKWVSVANDSALM